ncbi:MAG: hypothetical protein WEA04_04195 [Candidatus Andersenbacteria bacterium]
MPTALLSVYHKEGITDFAQQLVERGWDLLASGGTAAALAEADIPVKDIAGIVGPPILGHRVVTLSREIHAGLLAQNTLEDRRELKHLGILWIDLVCIDLYPLEQEIAKEGATPQSVLEKTDIGGPALLRSAAKGRRIVICDPADRQNVITWLQRGQPHKEATITAFAAKAEATVAAYCLASAAFHGHDCTEWHRYRQAHRVLTGTNVSAS